MVGGLCSPQVTAKAVAVIHEQCRLVQFNRVSTPVTSLNEKQYC